MLFTTLSRYYAKGTMPRQRFRKLFQEPNFKSLSSGIQSRKAIECGIPANAPDFESTFGFSACRPGIMITKCTAIINSEQRKHLHEGRRWFRRWCTEAARTRQSCSLRVAITAYHLCDYCLLFSDLRGHPDENEAAYSRPPLRRPGGRINFEKSLKVIHAKDVWTKPRLQVCSKFSQGQIAMGLTIYTHDDCRHVAALARRGLAKAH